MYKELIKKLETKYFFYREPTDNDIYNFLGKLKTIKSHFGYISDIWSMNVLKNIYHMQV